jgi:hypothetical protein
MVTDAHEHALAWWWRSRPSISWIAGASHPEPTSSPCSAARPRASITLADDLDLGGSSTKGWSVKDSARSDYAHRQLRKWSRRELIVGLVLTIGTLIFALLQISTHR